MVKVLKEGECINRKLIAVISFAYFVEALQFVIFILLKDKTIQSITRSSYFVDTFFTIANATLATVLYQLGIDQEIAANTQEQFELLVEDDPILNGSILSMPVESEVKVKEGNLDPVERLIARRSIIKV